MKRPLKTIRQATMERAGEAPAQETQPAAQGKLPSVPGDETFNGIVKELARLTQQGGLPEGMDVTALCADNAFVELAMEYPVEAAIRIYEAEKRADEAEQAAMERVTAQVRSRSALPKSARGGAMASPRTNYRDMDSETFRQVRGAMRRNARSGVKTRL